VVADRTIHTDASVKKTGGAVSLVCATYSRFRVAWAYGPEWPDSTISTTFAQIRPHRLPRAAALAAWTYQNTSKPASHTAGSWVLYGRSHCTDVRQAGQRKNGRQEEFRAEEIVPHYHSSNARSINRFTGALESSRRSHWVAPITGSLSLSSPICTSTVAWSQ